MDTKTDTKSILGMSVCRPFFSVHLGVHSSPENGFNHTIPRPRLSGPSPLEARIVDKDLRLAFWTFPRGRVLCGEHARALSDRSSFRVLPTDGNPPRGHLKRLRPDHRQLRYVSDPWIRRCCSPGGPVHDAPAFAHRPQHNAPLLRTSTGDSEAPP